MTRVVLTGGGGFLGWHVRAALRELEAEVELVALGAGADVDAVASAISGADLVVHLAGVNRGTDDEVRDGNAQFSEQLADAIQRADQAPSKVVYAGSIQTGGVYGDAKRAAADRLAAAVATSGGLFVDLALPNLFGEHGRPFYNSVTATFCHQLSLGETPRIDDDRELQLLHAQDAADILIGSADPEAIDSRARLLTVSDLLVALQGIADLYAGGDIPDLSDPFGLALFNTYRSFAHSVSPTHPLIRHSDARGSFFEMAKTHGGEGQTSFATSEPGALRGGHYHRRKIERFAVLLGRGRISMRRMFTEEVQTFDVDGDDEVVIDMPTMWTHDVTNTGDETLYLGLWISEVFRPERPDTIREPV
jgi:UDP-2-acetamido-2,6-beta-L-arabino-hexul-4-ose reductase